MVVNSPLGSNYIGFNHIFSNGYYGIHINNSPSNTIYSNTIEGNGQTQTSAGVRIEKSSGDGTADFNYIWLNQIRNNTGKGIQLVGGANEGIAAPVISSASCTDVSGTACPNCWVQIFSDEDDEGWILEGFMRASSSGVFSYLKKFHRPAHDGCRGKFLWEFQRVFAAGLRLRAELAAYPDKVAAASCLVPNQAA